MSKPDGLAEFLLKRAEQVEAERRAEAERQAAIMAHKIWLHHQAANRARKELEEYRKLLNDSRGLISSRDIKANEILIEELQGRLMSDPEGAEEEARIYRKFLEANVKRIRRAGENKRGRALERKSDEAMLHSLRYVAGLNELSKSIDELCNKWLSISRDNSQAGRLYVLLLRHMGFNVNSLSEARSVLKKELREAFEKRLTEKIKAFHESGGFSTC